MRRTGLFIGVAVLLAWLCAGQFAAGHAEEAAPPLQQLAAADTAFAQAEACHDGEGAVATLAHMIALEDVIRNRSGQPVELTESWQFDVSARFAKGNAALQRKLLSLVPYRRRGRDPESLNERFTISDTAYRREESFEIGKAAIVYVRSRVPGRLHLSVRSAEDGHEICSSFVEQGWPICYWTPQSAADAHVTLLVTDSETALGQIQVLTN